MDNLISVVAFSLPGLMAYYWLQAFGLNPAKKHSSFEMAAIAALLWIPTTLLTFLTYDLLYFVIDFAFKEIGVDASGLKLDYVFFLPDIKSMSESLIFLVYYIALSGVYSFVVAWAYSTFFFEFLLIQINKIRLKRRLSELDKNSSIWDTFFLSNDEPDESEDDSEPKGKSLVVEIYNINSPKEKIYGSVVNMSRPFETERSLIIDDPGGWKEDVEDEEDPLRYKVKRAYFDTKTGTVVNELEILEEDNQEEES